MTGRGLLNDSIFQVEEQKRGKACGGMTISPAGFPS
jgi:hypothetical protein